MASSTIEIEPAPDFAETLAALRDEISFAIKCISRDALGEFERSLWRQEMLCQRIKRVIGPSSFSRGSGETRQLVGEMCTELKNQSEVYAAVMHKCRSSRSFLWDLCCLYAGSRGHSASMNLSSLRCEA